MTTGGAPTPGQADADTELTPLDALRKWATDGQWLTTGETGTLDLRTELLAAKRLARHWLAAAAPAGPQGAGEDDDPYTDPTGLSAAELARKLSGAEMAIITWSSQNDYLRELLAEILAAFNGFAGISTARVRQDQIAEWRKRAGLDQETTKGES